MIPPGTCTGAEPMYAERTIAGIKRLLGAPLLDHWD